jgi:hypothetical protein
MITVYRLFQIIMGLILSGFIFYLLVSYAGNYGGVGKQATRYKTLDIFLQDADTVYFSGIPVNFEGFSGDDFSSCYPRPDYSDIYCQIDDEPYETRELLVPILLKFGDDVLITRNRLDYGWTSLDYVVATTTTRIVFSPVAGQPFDVMIEAARGLPDTSGQSPGVTFSLCDGNEIIAEYDSMKDFLDVLDGLKSTEFSKDIEKCTVSLGSGDVLVTVSDSCGPGSVSSGICLISSPDGVGEAYIAGSGDTYVYKDPADIAALIIGGDRQDEFGQVLGGETWEFKNSMMLHTLGVAAKIMEGRCGMIISIPGYSQECKDLYQELQPVMAEIASLQEGNPRDLGRMRELRAYMDEAASIWSDLLDTGCETHASG